MALLARIAVAALALSLATACSDGQSFSGNSGQKTAAAQAKDTARDAADQTRKDAEDDAPESRRDPKDDAAADEPKDDAAKDAGDDASAGPPPPDTAVTKGSFTAWTEPARPEPWEDYWIHIEVKLPSNAGDYAASDLAGRVVGTDGYTRGIGRDSKGALDGHTPPPWVPIGDAPEDRFSRQGTTARISVWVPGAEYQVRDRIDIRSDLLAESQTLEILFQ